MNKVKKKIKHYWSVLLLLLDQNVQWGEWTVDLLLLKAGRRLLQLNIYSQRSAYPIVCYAFTTILICFGPI